MDTDSSRQLQKSAGLVGLAVMFSRLLGLIREQVFAGLFGAGTANDAFVVAFRIPNLLRDLFGEGALSAAFVKVFTTYDQRKTREETWQLASIVLVFFASLLSVITLAAIVCSKYIIGAYSPAYALIPGKMELTVRLAQIMMPFLTLVSLSAVVMGILNTKGKFFIPALASCFFNLGSIFGGAGLALYFPKIGIDAITGMAIGTLLGGLMQLAVQIPTLLRTGFRFTLSFNFRHPGLISILKLMIPAVIGLSATQITIFVNTSFASSCGEGSVSWLQYSFRLVQLPIGIFGVAIGTAAMPLLSKFAALNDTDGLRRTFSQSLIMVFSLTFPAAVGLSLLAEPIIRLLFEHGAFSSIDTTATAQALSLYAIGLFAYAANKILVPVFYAIEKTKFPVIASFLAIITNIIIITCFIRKLEFLAIPLAVSVTMTINFFFLCIVLYRELAGYEIRALLISTGKIAAATCCMAFFIKVASSVLNNFLAGGNLQVAIAVAAIIAGSVILYSAAIMLFGVREYAEVIDRFKRRLCR